MGRKSSMLTTRGDATAREDLVICNSNVRNPEAGRYRTTERNPGGMGGSGANRPLYSESCEINRNCRCCSLGRNSKKRVIELSKISGLPFARFDPARKSAQIISRQYPRALSDPSVSARDFQCLLDHRNLGLVQLKVENLGRCGVLTREVLVFGSLNRVRLRRFHFREP